MNSSSHSRYGRQINVCNEESQKPRSIQDKLGLQHKEHRTVWSQVPPIKVDLECMKGEHLNFGFLNLSQTYTFSIIIKNIIIKFNGLTNNYSLTRPALMQAFSLISWLSDDLETSSKHQCKARTFSLLIFVIVSLACKYLCCPTRISLVSYDIF